MTANEDLLRSAIANLHAALQYLTQCTPVCPRDCDEVEHDGGEIDGAGAVDELLEAEDRIKRYLAIGGTK